MIRRMRNPSAVCRLDWGELPKHILDIVLEKLVSFSDYIRFSAVCVSWKCVALENRKKFPGKHGRQIPLLLMPAKDQEKETLKTLYNVITRKTLNLEVRVPLNTQYLGSSRGWLIALGNDNALTLINPIAPGAIIKFPPGLDHICKVILSADPILEPDNYTVFAIYKKQDGRVSYIRPGRYGSDDATSDVNWTHIDILTTFYEDLIYFENRLHVVCHEGSIVSFDCTTSPSVHRQVTPKLEDVYYNVPFVTYIVKLFEGDLLLVHRLIKYNYNFPKFRFTEKFNVYRWNPTAPNWVKIENLGNIALFLGDNMSTAVRASDFPGCYPNSIYFTQDFDCVIGYGDLGPRDCGVYNLENGSFSLYYNINQSSCLAMTEQPPIWFVPKLLN